MNRLSLAAAVLLIGSPLVQAQGDYTLTATSSNFTFSSTGTGGTSPLTNLVVTNSVNPDQPTNFMTAWQVNLMLAPDAGVMGTLNFNSPATGTVTTLPPNYVFPTGSFGATPPGTGNISVTNSGLNMRANDFDANINGSQVPISPGANLLQFDVVASANAVGTWGLFAVQGSSNTVWTNAAATPMTLPFINVPLTPSGGTIRIGTYTVVPEPTLCILAAAGGLGAWRLLRRRATR